MFAPGATCNRGAKRVTSRECDPTGWSPRATCWGAEGGVEVKAPRSSSGRGTLSKGLGLHPVWLSITSHLWMETHIGSLFLDHVKDLIKSVHPVFFFFLRFLVIYLFDR